MFQQKIIQKASELGKSIVFPEGEDPRIIQAAHELTSKNIMKSVLIGRSSVIEGQVKNLGIAKPTFTIVEPDYQTEIDAEQYYQKRKHKGMTLEKARDVVQHTAFKGALMLDRNEVDACLCGAVYTTGETVRAALHCIGLQAGMNTVSSFFLMGWPERLLLFSDCAVIPLPNENQLVDIALQSADSWKKLTGEEPRVAMLSFSTMGSAKHESIEPITAAVATLKKEHPDLAVDGDLQADAALIESIGSRKAPGSTVAGHANVLVFPNLHAGNICYKIAERLGGAIAMGPVLQGLAKPMNDLSRGCSAEDVVLTSALTVLQAADE
ncbi:MAG: phosphate acetyltransferase [Acidobacteria bacterium]|nr:MAG: phosphate acetyltransferase [Acidobacteriota bacterium]